MSDMMLEREGEWGGSALSVEEASAACDETVRTDEERNMGARSSRVALRIMQHVSRHVDERKLGMAFGSDCGFKLPGDEKKRARFPDGSVVVGGRLAEGETPEGDLKLAPDFALEVVSPNDGAYEVEEKRVAYLRAGVRLLWVVYPPTRAVFVYRAGGGVAVLTEADSLEGGDLLPDFRLPVARIFEDV